jgi:hypothetical protein
MEWGHEDRSDSLETKSPRTNLEGFSIGGQEDTEDSVKKTGEAVDKRNTAIRGSVQGTKWR